jgi:phosphoglycerate dehydrogenase-like enzyme
MSMLLVTVMDHLRELSVEAGVLKDVAEVRLIGPQWTREQAIASSDGLLMWHIGRLTAADIATMGRAKIIQRAGVGFDNVDLAAARAASRCVTFPTTAPRTLPITRCR